MKYQIPIVARGEVIEDYEVTYKGRYGADFMCPDPNKYLSKILLLSRREMESLYQISLDDVVDYLVEFGKHLNIDTNPHLQWALELARTFNDVPAKLVRKAVSGFNKSFVREHLEGMIATVGREHLEGWQRYDRVSGRISYIHAFGVPTAHVIAGNGPSPAFITFVRNALIRGYAIVKIPSNELGTAVALARTAIDMAPDHSLTLASCQIDISFSGFFHVGAFPLYGIRTPVKCLEYIQWLNRRWQACGWWSTAASRLLMLPS
jgi:hypothetical protein